MKKEFIKAVECDYVSPAVEAVTLLAEDAVLAASGGYNTGSFVEDEDEYAW